MEPLTMFASTVGFIGACHLISTIADRFGKRTDKRNDQKTERDDWYCFFQPSDLLGADWGKTDNKDQPQPTSHDNLEQRRRQQERRPRLQA